MLQDRGLEPETIPKNALGGERQHPAVSRAWLEPAGKAARFSDVVHGTRQGAWVSCAETPRDTCSDGEGPP